jgi:RNA polymerase sigma-70 factor (ECF subfamily)
MPDGGAYERLEPRGRQAEDDRATRLVCQLQAGDGDAFAELYMLYFDRVYGYLQIALRDPHEAEDGTQQVFSKAFEALPRYQVRPGKPFRAWLFVIVRNQALTQLARRGRVDPVEPAELDRHRAEDADDDAAELDWISDRELLMFIERLPLTQRQVLVLRFMLDFSSSQIAAVLGQTPDNVRQLQSQALRFLRQRLANVWRHSDRRGRIRMKAHVRPASVARARRFALQRW